MKDNTNAQIIATELKNKGFIARTAGQYVAISLTNRKPSIMEVKQAIDEFNEMGDCFNYSTGYDEIYIEVK